jgi:drug/metabolite transporter (DMT)-like permease
MADLEWNLGSTWLFIKLGLRDLPPISFAGIRFVTAAAVLAAIVTVRRLSLPRKARDWAFIALTGFLSFTVNYGLLFWGNSMSRRVSPQCCSDHSALRLVIAHFLLPNEPMRVTKTLGVLLGLVGVSVIFSNDISPKRIGRWPVSAAIVFGAFAVALSNVLIKSRGGQFDPPVLALGQMFFGLYHCFLLGSSRR